VMVDQMAWIIDRGLEIFFVDGKRDSPPGNETLEIVCSVAH